MNGKATTLLLFNFCIFWLFFVLQGLVFCPKLIFAVPDKSFFPGNFLVVFWVLYDNILLLFKVLLIVSKERFLR